MKVVQCTRHEKLFDKYKLFSSAWDIHESSAMH